MIMSDERTIMREIGEGLEVEVFYDYTPGEPPVYYPNDKAYPGCGPEVVVNRVEANGFDIMECLTDGIIQNIETYIAENVDND